MGLHIQTKILNFIIAGIKFSKKFQVKKLIWEFHHIIGDKVINPDIFVFFDKPTPFYSIIEMMSWKNECKTETKNRKIDQFKRFKLLSNDLINLPSEKIPATDAPFFINYVFYNTLKTLINNFIEDIRDSNIVEVYLIETHKKLMEKIETNSSINSTLLNELVQQADNNLFWRKIYVPFTLKDLENIKGDSENRIVISRKESRIVVSHILGFIINQKIINTNALFTISDIVDYIFSDSIIKIGEIERKALIGKIRFVIRYMVEILFPTLNLEVLEQITVNKYKIKLRNNKSLVERFNQIENSVKNYLAQETLDSYLDIK